MVDRDWGESPKRSQFLSTRGVNQASYPIETFITQVEDAMEVDDWDEVWMVQAVRRLVQGQALTAMLGWTAEEKGTWSS